MATLEFEGRHGLEGSPGGLQAVPPNINQLQLFLRVRILPGHDQQVSALIIVPRPFPYRRDPNRTFFVMEFPHRSLSGSRGVSDRWFVYGGEASRWRGPLFRGFREGPSKEGLESRPIHPLEDAVPFVR